VEDRRYHRIIENSRIYLTLALKIQDGNIMSLLSGYLLSGYLAYRIKKKNNIKHLSSLSQDTLRNLIIKIEGKKDVDQKLERLVKLLPTIDKY
jgi:uncharacterized protein (UPF0297 family)